MGRVGVGEKNVTTANEIRRCRLEQDLIGYEMAYSQNRSN
jgi:hypothetical protein